VTDASEKGLAPDFRFLEFGLAPLRPIDPELLVTGDDDVDGFVLSLALAYNDIKTIHWMNFLLQKHQPADTSTISPEAAVERNARSSSTMADGAGSRDPPRDSPCERQESSRSSGGAESRQIASGSVRNAVEGTDSRQQ